MSDDTLKLPIEADTATFVANLARASAALEKLADASKKTEEVAKTMPSTWEKAERAFANFQDRVKASVESASRFGEAYRNIKAPVVDLVEGLTAAAEQISRLAGEQARLDRASNGLGLSLQQAQEYAGGFADQTEIATAALTLQGQGIRIHQQELDALTRLAMRRAIDTGRDLHDVLENLTEAVTEGGEEFGKVAPELLHVADASHTAGERLAAMVEVANRVGPAARDASTEFERYTAAVQGSQRELAAGFVEELSHLSQITSKTHDARDATEEWNQSMRAVGNTVVYVGSLAGNTIGVIVGTIATAIATVPALIGGLSNAMHELTDTDNLRRGVAGDRAAAAFRASLNNDTLTALTDFVQARAGALGATIADQDTQRTSADPGRAFTLADAARNRLLRNSSNNALGGTAGQADMTFGLAEANSDMFFSTEQAQNLQRTWDTDDRNRQQAGREAARRRQQRGQQREQHFQQLLNSAGGSGGLPFSGESRPDLAVLTDAGLFEESAQTERDVGKSDAARTAQEAAFGQSDDTRLRDRRRDRTTERERREQETRLDQRESFLERWERLNDREIVANDVYAEALQATFEATGQSLATHFEGLAAGRETAAEFFEGLAADTMSALGKEAFGKGAFYTAEALGFAVTGNLASAGTAGAAAGAYFVAGGLLTAGAAALGGDGGSAPSTGGGGGGGSHSRPRLAGGGSDTGGQNTTTTIIHQYAPTFGGRQGSDAEAGQQVQRYTGAADRRRVQRDRS